MADKYTSLYTYICLYIFVGYINVFASTWGWLRGRGFAKAFPPELFGFSSALLHPASSLLPRQHPRSPRLSSLASLKPLSPQPFSLLAQSPYPAVFPPFRACRAFRYSIIGCCESRGNAARDSYHASGEGRFVRGGIRNGVDSCLNENSWQMEKSLGYLLYIYVLTVRGRNKERKARSLSRRMRKSEKNVKRGASIYSVLSTFVYSLYK